MTKEIKTKIIDFWATFAYLGKAPKAPGTFGTLGGIPIVLALAWVNNWIIYTIFLAGFFLFSLYISNEAEAIYMEKDPQKVVIDEVLGYITTMFFVPVNAITIILAFILFRIFDIWKPGPIKKMQYMKGGMGIIIDDFAAGIAACAILHLIVRFFHL